MMAKFSGQKILIRGYEFANNNINLLMTFIYQSFASHRPFLTFTAEKNCTTAAAEQLSFLLLLPPILILLLLFLI